MTEWASGHVRVRENQGVFLRLGFQECRGVNYEEVSICCCNSNCCNNIQL